MVERIAEILGLAPDARQRQGDDDRAPRLHRPRRRHRRAGGRDRPAAAVEIPDLPIFFCRFGSRIHEPRHGKSVVDRAKPGHDEETNRVAELRREARLGLPLWHPACLSRPGSARGCSRWRPEAGDRWPPCPSPGRSGSLGQRRARRRRRARVPRSAGGRRRPSPRRAASKIPGESFIDEVAAQWLVTAGRHRSTPRAYAVAFLLFRVFDIGKPWPVRWAERRVTGGLGDHARRPCGGGLRCPRLIRAVGDRRRSVRCSILRRLSWRERCWPRAARAAGMSPPPNPAPAASSRPR